MRYTVVSASEWTYPDRFDYQTGSSSIRLETAKGGFGSVQLLLDAPTCPAISLELPGAGLDVFEMLPIPVESNLWPEDKPKIAHFPEREAPYYIYDCLKPLTPGCTARMGQLGLYLRFTAPETAGVYSGSLQVGETAIPVELTVLELTVPAETLANVYWYSRPKIAELHNVPCGTPEFDAMEEKYLRLMRYMRQTVVTVDHPVVTELGDNKYAFDFSETKRQAARAFALGFHEISMKPVCGRKSWQEPTIYVYELDTMSYEGYCFLSQFLTALRDFLRENGWLNGFRIGVCDEPNDANEVTYRALAGLYHRLIPEARLTEAMSYCNVHGSIDTYVPLNAQYQQHRDAYETFRAAGGELWQYVCCGPRADGFINRFMDYPLLSTRYQYYGNYFYGLTGYLHWAFFQPQPEQDLFTQSCPVHRNANTVCNLPAGDTHLCYNGEDGPWMSIRLEQLRMSAEDYEWLMLLDKADPDKARAVCARVFRAFDDVDYDPNAFDAAHHALMAAAAAL